ncbi:phosphoenolpyruvate--protein phosphotransferase [Actinomadura parmotrematis]|uniref:Phosphoenolpyruvate-protein phosphotransferase n=1 Tax=Actinomadura parmotrematis TaxID=2864039 RepID=A0ABS7FW94_9ACTN|nr:phosphoenolpyruvate--protein phosphotransferase [Actinomadura parmotrematis]MBW8484541.1 phosphoenolpyruvate--protein phosphotransferase [Actinomadura parmotrematis]
MPDVLRGAGVSPGAGHGPVRAVAGAVPEPPAGAPAEAGDAERALAALEAVAADLTERGERAAAAGNAEGRDVLAAQALMARDPGLADAVTALVAGGTGAARAVFEAFAGYRAALAGAGEYLAARVADLDDIRDRAVARLLGVPMPGVPVSDEPFVLVARDLAPADTAVLDRGRVLAFVTEEGGPTSHTAIIARTLGVPAVVALPGATELADGTVVLVDGTAGTVTVDPTGAQVAAARAAAEARASAVADASGPGATRDGHRVPLLANIGGPQDVEAALAHGAEGVGLYRTEFLFLDRTEPPGDAEQEEAYRAVLEAFPEGKVVVRTLDAGADKPLAFLPPPSDEPNPALGERGLRMARRHPEILAAQLAALARASAGQGATLQVMAPMVTEAAEAARFAADCRAAGLDHPGVMVEVPAAALRARDLAGEVEFFSVGTNDLTQYAYAADRQVGGLAHLQDPWQPAVLDLVAMAADAGVPCGVCGEAAGDPVLACVLVGIGVTSLSMSAPSLPLVRAALARHSLEECREAAAAARAARSASGAHGAARASLPGLEELGL